MTITLPEDVIEMLNEAANTRGLTVEQLIETTLRRIYHRPPPLKPGETMRDRFKAVLGTTKTNDPALSQNCGEKFTDGLIADRESRS